MIDLHLRRAFRSRYGLVGLSLLLMAATAQLGCGDSARQAEPAPECDITDLLFAPKEGEPIASIGDHALLTVEELRERVAAQAPIMRARMQSPEGRRETVDQLVQLELLAREAARQNLHLAPEVQQALKRAMVGQLVSQRMRELEESEEISDEMLQAFYEENISEFVQPERVRVSHAFFRADSDSIDDREKARASAEERLAELRASATDDAGTFARMVRDHSDDAQSRAGGGDLRYQSLEQLSEAWGSAAAEAAFGLERVGSIGGVVEGEAGYHIFRLVGRQRAVDRKLEEIRPMLVNRVRRAERNRAFEAFVAELAEREGLLVDEEVLERMAATGPVTPEPDEGADPRSMPRPSPPSRDLRPSEGSEN